MKIANIAKAYINLNNSNIARLKSEGFSGRFSVWITYATLVAGLITGSLLVIIPSIAREHQRYYFIAIPLVNSLLGISILIQKYLHHKQIRKYRDSEEGLIKP